MHDMPRVTSTGTLAALRPTIKSQISTSSGWLINVSGGGLSVPILPSSGLADRERKVCHNRTPSTFFCCHDLAMANQRNNSVALLSKVSVWSCSACLSLNWTIHGWQPWTPSIFSLLLLLSPTLSIVPCTALCPTADKLSTSLNSLELKLIVKKQYCPKQIAR